MLGRLEILCFVTIASWLAGLSFKAYAGPHESWLLVVLLAIVGLVAAPVIGTRLVVGLSDFAEWENWGPRDFYPAALAIAAVICFALPIGICWAL